MARVQTYLRGNRAAIVFVGRFEHLDYNRYCLFKRNRVFTLGGILEAGLQFLRGTHRDLSLHGVRGKIVQMRNRVIHYPMLTPPRCLPFARFAL